MSQQLKRVAILYGGWSGEREVSLTSGRMIYEAFEKKGYPIVLIDVTPDISSWMQALLDFKPDVVFMNALHGRWVEDGCIQGLIEMLGLPYTASGVLSSALAFDKDMSRQIFQTQGLPIAPGIVVDMENLTSGSLPLSFPCVLKPLQEGSSLGVSILRSTKDVDVALKEWTFGPRGLLEKYIPGQELSVALLGDKPLGVLELEVKSGFYDYAAKYTDGLTTHHMPARISAEVYDRVMALSLKAAKALGCEGVSRVDWRYDANDKDGDGLYILEANTQPGMTPLSIVPEIAAYAGMTFIQLLEWMIENPKCQQKDVLPVNRSLASPAKQIA